MFVMHAKTKDKIAQQVGRLRPCLTRVVKSNVVPVPCSDLAPMPRSYVRAHKLSTRRVDHAACWSDARLTVTFSSVFIGNRYAAALFWVKLRRSYLPSSLPALRSGDDPCPSFPIRPVSHRAADSSNIRSAVHPVDLSWRLLSVKLKT